MVYLIEYMMVKSGSKSNKIIHCFSTKLSTNECVIEVKHLG